MSADAVWLVAGLALFVAVLAPVLVRSIALSAPMVLLLLGMLIGLLPMPDGWSLDPVAGRKVVEHVTEVAVLVALMGVGLALDRPLGRDTWRSWSPTWRLLLVAMPLTIAAIFVLGWSVLGVAAPAALLLGACLAPTDPVLAGDVQVDGPSTGGSPGNWPARSSSGSWSARSSAGAWGGSRSGPRTTACASRSAVSRCWPSLPWCCPTGRRRSPAATDSWACSPAGWPCAASSATTTTTGPCTRWWATWNGCSFSSCCSSWGWRYPHPARRRRLARRRPRVLARVRHPAPRRVGVAHPGAAGPGPARRTPAGRATRRGVLRGPWRRIPLLPGLRRWLGRPPGRAVALVGGRLHDPAVGRGARGGVDAGTTPA